MDSPGREMPVPDSTSSSLPPGVVLEGMLLKQGDGARRGLWHERYFVFTKDGTLQYYNPIGGSKHDGSHSQHIGNSSSSKHSQSNGPRPPPPPPSKATNSNFASYRNQKPKASYRLSDLTDVEIGDIYVQKGHHKKIIYCFHLSWAADCAGTGGGDSLGCPLDDASSHVVDNASVSNDGETDSQQALLQSPVLEQRASPRVTPKRSLRKPFLRKAKSERLLADDEQDRSTPTIQNKRQETGPGEESENGSISAALGRSVDEESLTMPGRKSALRHRRRRPTGGASASGVDTLEQLPQIPSLVEVNNAHLATTSSSSSRHEPQSVERHPSQQLDHRDSAKTIGASNVTAGRTPSRTIQQQQVDDETIQEQEFLHWQYHASRKAKRKKHHRKMVQGTQVALATGAAIGVAVATAGIGLVAGFIVLGVGAAAGGGGAVVNFLGRKRQGEMIIGSTDYEEAKLWKSTLEAYLRSASLQKTTWGQLFASDGRETRSVLMPGGTKAAIDLSTVPEQPNISANGGFTEKRDQGILLDNSTTWAPLVGGWTSFLGTGVQGLRIFREERSTSNRSSEDATSSKGGRGMSVDGRPCPPVKAHVVLNTAALDAFLCLMSYGRVPDSSSPMLTPNDGQQASFRRVANIDEHTDIIHLFFRPLYLFPSWTTPRDFVLFRYWRFEPDGTYLVCYESVEHSDCPPHPDFVRGEMHQVFTIAPLKKKHRRRISSDSTKGQPTECFMSAVVQVDPKGWVPVTPLPVPCLSNHQGYGDAFGVAALLQLLDVRDAIDQERFVSVSLDTNKIGQMGNLVRAHSFEMVLERDAVLGSPGSVPHVRSMDSADEVNDDPVNYDFKYARRESIRCLPVEHERGFAAVPPLLPFERWAEPDANSFRVRGKQYKVDRKKFNAGSSIGRLVAVDVVRADQPVYSGFSVHPTERIQLALRRDEKLSKEPGKVLDKDESDLPPFVFVMNIVLPGTPFFHGVFYFAIDDMSTIDGTDGTPSSRLCNEFFFGDSDEFRDKTFKMIPQIVQGNFLVRKAVGSTPAITGTKLRQLYVKSDRFFEVIMDCGSDAVATAAIRLSLRYARTLVVDLGFLFEGDDESTLPERIFGCVRIKHLIFDDQLRKVEAPPPQS